MIFNNHFSAVLRMLRLMLAAATLLTLIPGEVAAAGWLVRQLEIDGAVGPATSDYVRRNLDDAAEQGVKLVILRIDTPGGLDTSMREIIKKILASPVPVVGYVAPGGARAASAGTYILYACPIAAMAPATNLGAATPVQIPGIASSPPQSDGKASNHGASGDALTEKMVNDAVAYIRGLARMHGRNADWAEKAVRQAASLPAEEALQQHVIDLIANDEQDLLAKLNGLKVNVLGQEIVLQTVGAKIDRVGPDWRSRVLAIISNPNIAYILLLIGLYGIAVEFTHPGTVAGGTVGVICLLLALYAFQLLPVNFAGIALIIFGLGLMVAEAFVPSFGILGIGGVCAFVFGSVVLIDSDVPGFGINRGLVGGFALTSVVFFIFVLAMLLKARRKPVVSGKEELLGSLGKALEDFSGTGRVHLQGETWQALTDRPLQKNDPVKVTGIDGLLLKVTRYHLEEKH